MLTEITFPEDLTRPLGLASVTFRDLKRVVVLAGPNGSGKSRYLGLVPPVLQLALTAAKGALDTRAHISHNEAELEKLKKHGAARRPGPGPVQKLLGQQTAQLTGALQRLHAHLAGLDARARLASVADTARSGVTITLSSVEVVPGIKDPDSLPPRQLRAVSTSLHGAPISQLHEHLHVYLETIALALYDAKHPDVESDSDDGKAAKAARQFNELIKALLGTSVGHRRVQGVTKATLFDRIVDPKELSAGQKLLITWAMCAHLQHDGRLKGNILLVDEPEKHLHPEACIRVLERLEHALGDTGQMWIATHSPAIVPRFGTGSLYSVHESAARYAGSGVTGVMNGLLGGDGARRDFAAFLSEAEELDFLTFAAQCLVSPVVAEHAKGDRQGSAVARIIAEAQKNGHPLRVLDYGAGKGRFAAALAEVEDARARFDFYAYNDPLHAEHEAQCRATMRRLYPDDSTPRVFSEISEFWKDKRVDLVVMCNFLHEVPPKDWCDQLATCAKVLRESGVLVLMEDQCPPIGELPHRNGFVVLDHSEVRFLFGSSTEPRQLSKEDRLSAVEVPQPLLCKANTDTVCAALQAVVKRAEREIEHLRLNPDELSRHPGRRHAYFALLHINACLALRAFGRNSYDDDE